MGERTSQGAWGTRTNPVSCGRFDLRTSCQLVLKISDLEVAGPNGIDRPASISQEIVIIEVLGAKWSTGSSAAAETPPIKLKEAAGASGGRPWSWRYREMSRVAVGYWGDRRRGSGGGASAMMERAGFFHVTSIGLWASATASCPSRRRAFAPMVSWPLVPTAPVQPETWVTPANSILLTHQIGLKDSQEPRTTYVMAARGVPLRHRPFLGSQVTNAPREIKCAL